MSDRRRRYRRCPAERNIPRAVSESCARAQQRSSVFPRDGRNVGKAGPDCRSVVDSDNAGEFVGFGVDGIKHLLGHEIARVENVVGFADGVNVRPVSRWLSDPCVSEIAVSILPEGARISRS